MKACNCLCFSACLAVIETHIVRHTRPYYIQCSLISFFLFHFVKMLLLPMGLTFSDLPQFEKLWSERTQGPGRVWGWGGTENITTPKARVGAIWEVQVD